MAKTQEELNQLKNEYKTLSNKLKELSEEELKEITGGKVIGGVYIKDEAYECPAGDCLYNSKEECPHANYGRQKITDCKYN